MWACKINPAVVLVFLLQFNRIPYTLLIIRQCGYHMLHAISGWYWLRGLRGPPSLSVDSNLFAKNLHMQSLWYRASAACRSNTEPTTRLRTSSANTSSREAHFSRRYCLYEVCPAPIQLIDTNRPASIYLDFLDPYICHMFPHNTDSERINRMMYENDVISWLEWHW